MSPVRPTLIICHHLILFRKWAALSSAEVLVGPVYWSLSLLEGWCTGSVQQARHVLDQEQRCTKDRRNHVNTGNVGNNNNNNNKKKKKKKNNKKQNNNNEPTTNKTMRRALPSLSSPPSQMSLYRVRLCLKFGPRQVILSIVDKNLGMTVAKRPESRKQLYIDDVVRSLSLCACRIDSLWVYLQLTRHEPAWHS